MFLLPLVVCITIFPAFFSPTISTFIQPIILFFSSSDNFETKYLDPYLKYSSASKNKNLIFISPSKFCNTFANSSKTTHPVALSITPVV